jgi:hypothetical protein
MMNLFTMSRGMARLEYTAVRLPFTLLDERIVARYWHDQGLFRLGFQRFLGSIDELAGWLLADDDISTRGQALTRPERVRRDELKVEAAAGEHSRSDYERLNCSAALS